MCLSLILKSILLYISIFLLPDIPDQTLVFILFLYTIIFIGTAPQMKKKRNKENTQKDYYTGSRSEVGGFILFFRGLLLGLGVPKIDSEYVYRIFLSAS